MQKVVVHVAGQAIVAPLGSTPAGIITALDTPREDYRGWAEIPTQDGTGAWVRIGTPVLVTAEDV